MLKRIGDALLAATDWIYKLPPDRFKEYEVALGTYLVALHILSPKDEAMYVAIGFAIYGLVKAVRDVATAVNPLIHKG